MTKNPSFFDDISKIAGSFMQQGFSTASEMREKFDQSVKDYVQELLAKSDMVTREEFDVVKEMASKARSENEALKARIDTLEKASSKNKGKK